MGVFFVLYKTCIYSRKSTSKLGQSETIDNQIRICQSKAEQLGLDIVDIKTDTGTGKDDLSRPEVKELIDDAINGKYNCVLMKGISRFYRDTEKGLSLIKQLDRYNVRVVTVEEGFDSLEQRTGNGKLDTSRITMYLMFAEMESQKTADRVKYTQLEKAKKGEWNIAAKAPYGYKYNSDTKRLEVDEVKAEIVRKIFNLYEEGNGARGIALQLNEQGIPSPSGVDWNAKRIWYILKNRTYIGDVVFNMESKRELPYKNPDLNNKSTDDMWIGNSPNDESKWIIKENAHDAIITREQFEAAQDLLKTKATNKAVKQEYALLAGIIKCGRCGKGMTLKKRYGDRHKDYTPRYYCIIRHNKGAKYCDNGNVNMDIVESHVINDLKELYTNSSQLDAIIKKYSVSISGSGDNTQKEISSLEQKVNSLMVKMDKLLEKNLDGDITDQQFKNLNTKYADELGVLTEKLNTLKDRQSIQESSVTKIEKFKRDLENVINIDKLDTEQKRLLLLKLINRVDATYNKDTKEHTIHIEYQFENPHE
jgi:site-specific DNA recombinase